MEAPQLKADYVQVKARYLVPRKVTSMTNDEIPSAVPTNADATLGSGNSERESEDIKDLPETGNKRKVGDSDDTVGNKSDAGESKNFQRVALKKRHSKAQSSYESRLCLSSLRGEECKFGKECRYSHDIKEYLLSKESDLGPRCYQYDTFGQCPNGIMCRFGDIHTDREKGLSIIRAEEEGGVIDRTPINVLSKDIQALLRKKKYSTWPPGPGELQLQWGTGKGSSSGNKNDGSRNEEKRRNIQVESEIVNVNGASDSVAADGLNGFEDANDNQLVKDQQLLRDTQESEDKEMIPITSSSLSVAAAVAGTGASPSTSSSAEYNLNSYPDKNPKLVDFTHKVYVAPLTTVGNLPFRRILKEFGADITCGEMAMSNNLVLGQASEWALLRRHASEDCFGMQLAGGYADTMGLTARILDQQTQSDFVDLNCGCPIDAVCKRGSGSTLMVKSNRLYGIVDAMCKGFKSRSVTVKIRTGWSDNQPCAHQIVPQLQKRFHGRLAAVMVHGRSRLQRYHKLANWNYVLKVAQSQDPSLPRIPIIGNGDIMSWQDWRDHQDLLEENMHNLVVTKPNGQANDLHGNLVDGGGATGISDGNDDDEHVGATAAEIEGNPSELLGLCSCAMLGRGALIKPWLPQEIHQKQSIDISAPERLEMLKKFCNYGLEHWGSDQQGVNNTRRFLLEWLSFLHRYVPLGLLEYQPVVPPATTATGRGGGDSGTSSNESQQQVRPQTINQRPPHYFGRCDLETLLASSQSTDWVKISEMLLGPVPLGFNFVPKHRSNAYAPDSEALPEG